MDCLIIHYNTPELTSATIRSLWKHTPQAKVTLFDNSDRRPFQISEFPQVSYIDNTKGGVVNWVEWLKQFPNKQSCWENNYGSAKHCYSVESCFDLFQDGFVLMDSDVLVKKDITPLYDSSKAFVGRVHCNSRQLGAHLLRVNPWICFINTQMLKQYGIRYFNRDKMWKMSDIFPNYAYDTGAWLYEQVCSQGLPFSNIEIFDYIEHLRAASWKPYKDRRAWLESNKELWQ